MTITPEDGTGLANANSYVASAAADTFIANLPQAECWSRLDDTGKESALVQATKYLDLRYRFYGKPNTTTQALQWPRTKNYDYRGIIINAGTIPQQLKDACCWLAAKYAEDPDVFNLAVDSGGAPISWESDEIKIGFDRTPSGGAEQAANSALIGTRYPDIDMLLRSIGTLVTEEWRDQDKRTFIK